MDLDLARQLSVTGESKIMLFVIDGLGGLPHLETGRTELETARRGTGLLVLPSGGVACADPCHVWPFGPIVGVGFVKADIRRSLSRFRGLNVCFRG